MYIFFPTTQDECEKEDRCYTKCVPLGHIQLLKLLLENKTSRSFGHTQELFPWLFKNNVKQIVHTAAIVKSPLCMLKKSIRRCETRVRKILCTQGTDIFFPHSRTSVRRTDGSSTKCAQVDHNNISQVRGRIKKRSSKSASKKKVTSTKKLIVCTLFTPPPPTVKREGKERP